MNVTKLSTCIITDQIESTKMFYLEALRGKLTFDCGWYISISLGSGELQFMTPQSEQDKLFLNQGVTFNMQVADVDAEYRKICDTGVTIVNEIKDNPWGDRSFVICDPNGVRLYIYSDREPAEEFKAAISSVPL